MSNRYSIALRKDNTLRIVTTAGLDETYPRTTGNLELLEQYLQTLPGYERRSSDNPEVDEVINFEGYFHSGDYYVDCYLHFSHQPDRKPQPVKAEDLQPIDTYFMQQYPDMTPVYLKDVLGRIAYVPTPGGLDYVRITAMIPHRDIQNIELIGIRTHDGGYFPCYSPDSVVFVKANAAAPEPPALTRKDMRNVTTDELSVGMDVYLLDMSKIYRSLDPNQPAHFYGTIATIEPGKIAVRFEDGTGYWHTFRGNATRWYVRREVR